LKAPLSALRGVVLLLPLASLLVQVACAPAPDPFPLEAVVRPALAQARAALPAQAEPPDPDGDLLEQIDGLLGFVNGLGGRGEADLRAAALEEAAGLGQAAVAPLAERAMEGSRPDGERAAAIEFLGSMGGARAGEALLAITTAGDPAWVRAHAAWRSADARWDGVVPDLVLRLKYETDHEVVVWIADSLARFRNLAGLDGLIAVADAPSTPEIGQLARARLTECADGFGFADGRTLRDAWQAGSIGTMHGASPQYTLSVWAWIARLDEFQLRGVDDARFLLQRLDSGVAPLLARALHDESRHIRFHAAQCLQRMGPRAFEAVPDLLLALDLADLAPQAAEALGSIGDRSAMDGLAERLNPGTAPALRIAAARALGGLLDPRDTAILARLEQLAGPSQPMEMRQAAAESFTLGSGSRDLVPFLIELLSSPLVEARTTEEALSSLLTRAAGGGSDQAAAVLEDWRSLEPTQGTILTAEEKRSILRKRTALMESWLAAPESD